MSENQNQNENKDASVYDFDQPYTSSFHAEDNTRATSRMDEQTLTTLQSQAATKSFLLVFLGLIITTISAYVVLSSPNGLIDLVLGGGFFIFAIAEIAVVIANGYAIKKDNLSVALGLYIIYAILNGVTMSVVFMAYQIGSIKEAFLLTCLVFGVMAAYGYFTKKDLSTVGSICMMGLLGVIIVSLANTFIFKSAGMDMLMNYVVVLLFVGITAYDMAKMKKLVEVGGEAEINKIALYTGMELYLDFINLFLRIVRILNRRR